MNIEKIIKKMHQQPNGIRPDLITIKQENPLKKAYIVDVLNRIGM